MEEVKIFQIGAISSYISTYIAHVIEKEFFNRNIVINIGEASYFSATIAGAFSAPIIAKTNLLEGVLAAVALFKASFIVVDAVMNCREVNTEYLLRDYIFDSIFIFFIIWLIEITKSVFTESGQPEVNQENSQIETEEEIDIINDIIISTAINVYFVYKRYILEKLLTRGKINY